MTYRFQNLKRDEKKFPNKRKEHFVQVVTEAFHYQQAIEKIVSKQQNIQKFYG